MRCIETEIPHHKDIGRKPINYNMRCIETKINNSDKNDSNKINYNMRCIETYLGFLSLLPLLDKLQHEMY